METMDIRITHLAGLGDGVGEYNGKKVFVPLTCPGDTVRVAMGENGKAQLREILVSSPDRAVPPCPDFGACGGCNLQQLSFETYREFKHGIALKTAAQLGADASVVKPLFLSGPSSRRRAEMKVGVNKGEVSFGFLAAGTHSIVNVTHCQVVDKAIAHSLDAWRAVLATLKKPSLIRAIEFTQVDSGLDVILHVVAPLRADDRERLVAFAHGQEMQRLCERKEESDLALVLHQTGNVQVRMGNVPVELPAGIFLQATAVSQREMAEQVMRQCAGHGRVADLYSGCGTFSLPLARVGHAVHAYEGNADAVTAAFNAARASGLETRLQCTVRDLFAAPLQAGELKSFDAAVINPPRNGALPQAKQLAESGINLIIMVSCNPATFVRDAKVFLAKGYTLKELMPIDQFTWSSHLELVGVFRKSC